MKGKELEQFLKESSDELLLRLKTGFAPYDGVSLGLQWKDFYWKVEEFINLFEDLDSDDEDNMAESLVGDFFTCPESLCKSLIRIKQLYGVDTAVRMLSLATLFSDTEFKTISDLYFYCKSRRLHFASMLYLIPMFAKGDKQINEDDMFKELSWCIEL